MAESVIFFGNPRDPELAKSINRVAITGRPTQVIPRPSFDTGLGKCGKHICSCKTICTATFSELEKQFG